MRKKKTEKRKLKDKLEKLVKGKVKERDKNTCQKCLKVVEGSNCHASHVIPVSNDMRLAFDPENLKVLCYHCHINWWHKNPMEAAEWYKNKFPNRIMSLNEKHKINTKLGSITMGWYVDKFNELKNEL